MPEINTANVSDATEKIKVMASAVSESKTSWQNLFDTLPESEKYFAQLGQQMEGQIITEEGVIQANQQARTSALAHNEAIKAQTLSAKAGTVALKALSIAGNMIAMWAISKVISTIAEKIDNLAHASEKCKERVDELISTYQSVLDTANNNAKTVEDLAARYETLSKGVNNLGETYGLTTEETKEYHDICNQIADMFPTLVQGYTNEGNAILSLKGNVEQLRNAYKEAQQEAYNLLIVDGKDSDGNDIIKNWQNITNGNFWEAGNVEIITYLDQLSKVFETKEELEEYQKTLVNSSGQLVYWFHEFTGLVSHFNIDDLSDKDLAVIRKKIQAQKQTYQAEINSALKGVKTLANAYLMTNEDYANFDDQSKNAASIIVNRINENIANGFENKEAVGEYVIGIVESIRDNPEIQDALVGLFTLDTSDRQPEDVKELVDQYINYIASVLEESPVELKARLGFEDVDTIATNYRSVMQKAAEKFAEKTPSAKESRALYDAELDELIKFAEENSINTQDEIAFWNKCIDESETRQEAMEKYLESPFADDDPISFSSILSDESLSKFQSAIDSLKSSLTTLYNGNYSSTDLISSLSNINKVLSDIGKSDVLNWEKITNVDDLDNVIDQITNEYVDGMLESLDMAGTDFGNTIRNVIQEELKASRQLETYKSNVSDLQTAYSNLTDIIETYNANGYITFDQLTSLLEMEPQYLSCLIDDNGQLQLNTQAMADLAQLRLDEARAQVIQEAISELNRLSEEKQTQAVNDNSNAYIENENTIKHWNDTLYTAMQNAGMAAPLFAELSTALGGAVSSGVSDEAVNQVLDNAYKQFQMIDQMESSIGSNLGDVLGKTGSGSSSSATSDFSETIDFFERRVEVLDDALSHLKSTLDNVTGSFAKNNLIDAELGITEEEFRNYTDALSMYTQKANEAFSKIPADIASTVKDGAVSLTKLIGGSNEDVVEAIKEYESWADKIADCQQELAELKKEIRQLELDKFNNIMDDFQNQFDLRGDSKDLISKQIDLLKEAGKLIGESFFTAQIDQSKKQLELLEAKKTQLVHQMSSAISAGRIQQGTDEWLEMVNALSDVDGSILDCKKSIEEFDNEILNLHTEIFNRIQDQFSDLDSEISNIIDLFDDFEVSDDKGIWSKEAIAQLGLLSQQYELAQYRVQQYNDEIDKLNAQYLAGKYSATEYGDKLGELNSAQWDAVKSAESARDALMDLNEARIENQIKGIEKEIDAYKELIDAQIEALSASKDLHDYENSISEKTKSITNLEHQIAAMQNDTSASTVAKRKKLEQELADAQKDLEETEYAHSIEVQEDALNKQYENYEKTRNEEIDKLRESLNDKETILAESFNTVKNNASLVGQEIATVATQHGITVSKALVSSWQSGENAIAGYGEVLAPQTSAFVGNVKDIETEVYNLQEQADAAAGSMAGAFSAKADSLVNELTTSYGAASNLAITTDALHTSLINTLQSGYDVSSIVNSLNAITVAANKASSAVGGLPNTNVPQSTIQHGVTDGVNTLYSSSNIDDINKWLNKNKNIYSLGNVTTSASGSKTFKVKKYASGSRNIEEDQLAITNEAGQELIYHASDGSILTPLRQGDKVFDNESVNRLWQLGHGLTPPDILKNLAMPTVLPNNVNNTNNNPVQIGNLINVQGNVDSSNIKQMEVIANKAVDKLVNRLHDGLTYGR